jgi:hypothetical protein
VENLSAIHADWLLAIGNAVEEARAEKAEEAGA